MGQVRKALPLDNVRLEMALQQCSPISQHFRKFCTQRHRLSSIKHRVSMKTHAMKCLPTPVPEAPRRDEMDGLRVGSVRSCLRRTAAPRRSSVGSRQDAAVLQQTHDDGCWIAVRRCSNSVAVGLVAGSGTRHARIRAVKAGARCSAPAPLSVPPSLGGWPASRAVSS